MSELDRALEWWENNQDVELDRRELRRLCGVFAARRFASLTSPETIEKGAKTLAAWFIDDGDESIWDDDMDEDDRRGWRVIAEAVLRSVEEGKT